jgi:chromosome segregation ATPase
MTPEDLQAIRAIIREEIAGSEQRLRAEIAGSEQRLRAEITASEQRITHATAANLSDLREELIRRIEELSRRIETLERRFENLTPVILSIDTRMGAFTRAVDQLLTAHGETANTVTTQRVIDQLVARVTRIEREIHPEQQQ